MVSKSSRNPRILYIDDNSHQDSHREETVSALLRSADVNQAYCVSTATTAREALELIASEPFDLFILGYQLPEMSGVELCRRIRKTDKLTPILFITKRARLADCQVSVAAGATEYVVKPIGAEYLIETVRHLLNDFHVAKPNCQASSCNLAK
jgi:DNA-binding response OmpR family regulator